MAFGSIIAVGGGKVDGTAREFMEYGLDLTQPEIQPSTLIIPTAKTRQDTYDKAVRSAQVLFTDELGLPCDTLHDFNEMPSKSELEDKLQAADFVYVTGGDSNRMMRLWREYGVDEMIKNRLAQGLVYAGTSAGAIAPFAWGHSDYQSNIVAKGEEWDFVPVDGLGVINAAVVPHADRYKEEQLRLDAFKNMFEAIATEKGTNYGFGLENQTALTIVDGTISGRTSREDGMIHVIHDGQVTQLGSDTIQVTDLS